ncbi:MULTISPECIES: DUF1800 domain-containing protein [Rhizobium]|uniref:DUF1800 domain-containing protein n=1 Tax=Rhizobium leguminosarum bv. trifolii (strain WSM1325) TaxID=395491 RepID=C6B1Z7_RHILS|nr:DUF1800 domain-containing protein [Rhizobium leguminosarum]ACS56746.1 Protein of unknown function DUF1800 [Rhizobium leguminosarum bv. trifolii WSM1325]MBY2906415.1 DUF1800 domain-containing protein [Rhizobium leguminosarum]MBY2946007.1 DUF1800 domain-containing protein [Rhizobium leguminosarum]MBY2963680.1 DUF1800 domain-containing protein [Rhizobium leguminosarum]MBY2983976.1 DUF1800 domain-containing protein [Rhizobium leguminosarum]
MSLSFPTMAAIRFGYGFRPGEAPPSSKDELIDQLRKGAAATPDFPLGGPNMRHQAILSLQEQLQQIRQDAKTVTDDTTQREMRKGVQRQAQQQFQHDANLRLMQAVLSPYGFYERLSTFWTNHFSTSANKSLPMRLIVPLYEAEAIRPFISGTFGDLLRNATAHPAMLIYLDQADSLGPDSAGGIKRNKGLNENLGRELLELHTLGAGSGYSQADVTAAAMVLTGLTIDRKEMDIAFRPNISEPGTHEVLGVSYGGRRRSRDDYLDMLDDLALHPKTAAHISRKLAVHFIADQPDEGMVSDMAEAWKKTDGDLTAVYTAMLDHPAAWRDEGAKARQPFDYVVTGLRALNAGPVNGVVGSFLAANQQGTDEGDMAANTPGMAGSPVTTDPAGEAREKRLKAFQTARALGQGALRRMGQPTWLPPSPAGFEEGFSAWITGSQLAERLAWARRAAAQFGRDEDPREFLKSTLADAARDETIRVVSQAPNKISGLTLVLASPEFNRR